MKFNVFVTIYVFIMYDRSKLSRVNWKYIIIDKNALDYTYSSSGMPLHVFAVCEIPNISPIQ